MTERRLTDVFESYDIVPATFMRRLAAELIDSTLILVSLPLFLIPALIWFAAVAPRGQSPGKQLLDLYILDHAFCRAGGGATWLREWPVKRLAGYLTFGLYFLGGGLWALVDERQQTLWDKLGQTYVGYSPEGFQPPTAKELREMGYAPLMPTLSQQSAEFSASMAGLRDRP